jgi:4-hydroxybenzoate polyprenyltransferase
MLFFCGTLFVYNLDSALDGNTSTSSIAGNRTMTMLGLLFFLIALIRTSAPLRVLCAFSIPLAIGTLYALPIPLAHMQRFRLKDIPGMKAFITGGAITVAVTGLPLVLASPPHICRLLTCGAALFTFAFVNVVLCDFKDMKSDRERGVKTLPILFGAEGTRLLLAALCCGTTFLLATVDLLTVHAVPALLYTLPVLSILLTLCANARRPDRWYSLWVEGSILPLGLLCALGAGV